MPIATPKQYTAMLDAAQEEGYAYAGINVSSLVTLNGALKGFADRKSDGIVQFSTGAGEFVSGLNVKDMVLGTIVLAEAAHKLAAKYDVMIALHTDHCQPKKVDTFLRPLIAETARRRAAGLPNLFLSHMLDASPQDRRRNRRQEAVRPAQLLEGSRERRCRAAWSSLRRFALDRQDAVREDLRLLNGCWKTPVAPCPFPPGE